jgi:hypothetical protein
MINPDKLHKLKGTVTKLGPSWLFIEMENGITLETTLMNIAGFKVGDKIKGTAQYYITADSYVINTVRKVR